MQELVEHFERHSLSRHFPGMETTLETPFRVAIARKTNSFDATCSSYDMISVVVAAGRRWAWVVRGPDLPTPRATKMS